jgi:hypothetical protein
VLPGKDNAKDLGVLNIAGTLPYSVAPALAPATLAIGNGSYGVLYAVAGDVTACVQEQGGDPARIDDRRFPEACVDGDTRASPPGRHRQVPPLVERLPQLARRRSRASCPFGQHHSVRADMVGDRVQSGPSTRGATPCPQSSATAPWSFGEVRFCRSGAARNRHGRPRTRADGGQETPDVNRGIGPRSGPLSGLEPALQGRQVCRHLLTCFPADDERDQHLADAVTFEVDGDGQGAARRSSVRP